MASLISEKQVLEQWLADNDTKDAAQAAKNAKMPPRLQQRLPRVLLMLIRRSRENLIQIQLLIVHFVDSVLDL